MRGNTYRTRQKGKELLSLCILLASLLLFSCGQAPAQETSLQATIGALETQIAKPTQLGPSPEQQTLLPQQAPSPEQQTPPPQQAGSNSETPVSTPTPGQSAVQSDAQSAAFDTWKLTIVDVDNNAPSIRLTDGRTQNARDGYRFVVMKYTIENIGDSVAFLIDNRSLQALAGSSVDLRKSFLPKKFFGFSIIVDGDYTYNWSPNIPIRIDFLTSAAFPYFLPPKFRTSHQAVIEVPKIATGLKLNVVLRDYSQGDPGLFHRMTEKPLAIFDITHNYQDPGYIFPSDINIMKLGSDKLVLPNKLALSVSSLDIQDTTCTISLLVENLGGYDLRIQRGFLSSPVGSYTILVSIFQEDGNFINPKESNYNFSNIPPGNVLTYSYVDTPCQLTKTSKVTIAVTDSSSENTALYGSYNIE